MNIGYFYKYPYLCYAFLLYDIARHLFVFVKNAGYNMFCRVIFIFRLLCVVT